MAAINKRQQIYLIGFYGIILVLIGVINVLMSTKKSNAKKVNIIQELAAVETSLRKPPESFFFPEQTIEYYEQVLQYAESWALKCNYIHQLIEAGKYKQAIEVAKKYANNALPEEIEEYITPLLIVSYLKLGLRENCGCQPCIIPFGPTTFSKKENFEAAYKLLRNTEKLGEPILNVIPSYLLYGKTTIHQWDKASLLGLLEEVLGIQKKQYTISNKPLISKKVSFKDITEQVGLSKPTEAGSAVVDDFNNDGYLDLIVVNMGINSQLNFYVNEKGEKFTNKTEEAGLLGLLGGNHIVQTDYNNDGWLDLFITRGAWYGRYGLTPNSLLRNNGNGSFTDVTQEAGVYTKYPAQTAIWTDFNMDGWLDLFVGNDDVQELMIHSELYMNNGDGTFRNSTKPSGINAKGQVRGVVPVDYDKDGDSDLLVHFYHRPNVLYENNHKKGVKEVVFTDVSESILGVGTPTIHDFISIGFDYDNDGDVDIFHSAENQISTSYLHLLEDKGQEGIKKGTGLIDIEQDITGLSYGDFNNDGFQDLIIVSEAFVPNRLFINNKGKGFIDETITARVGYTTQGNGISIGDIDNDGDQDLYIVNGGYIVNDKVCDALLENTLEESNWISLKLEGITCNRAAIGTKIEVIIIEDGEKKKIYRTVNTGSNLGSSSLRQTIGLGKVEKIENIKVFWYGSNQVQTLEQVELNQHYELTEGKNLVKMLF